MFTIPCCNTTGSSHLFVPLLDGTSSKERRKTKGKLPVELSGIFMWKTTLKSGAVIDSVI